MFGYNLSRTCNEIRPTYSYDISCQGTVPEAIIAFLESTDYESAIRLTISLRGDADTMGGYYGWHCGSLLWWCTCLYKGGSSQKIA